MDIPIDRLETAEFEIMRKYFGVALQLCRACSAVWEAFPAAGYVEDPVCAEPCDNCAFRPGSPEQQDKEGWKTLTANLRPGGDPMGDHRFYCHKHVAIDLTKGPGNFIFPTYDGLTVAGTTTPIPDTSKMRTCSGYLRMLWALNAKAKPA